MGPKRSAANDSDEDQARHPKVAKKSKHDVTSKDQDDDGNPFWELSDKRRVGVSEFKGACLINIREYYDKDGKLLPGKKGISLSLAQYAALVKAIPAINATLKEKGYTVDFAAEAAENASELPQKVRQVKEKSSKANIDATSDEDEG